MRRYKYIVILFFCSVALYAQKIKTPDAHLQSFVRFTENKHQWSDNILYKAQLDGGALFVEKSGQLTYNLYDKDSYRLRHVGKSTSDYLKYHAYSISFEGSIIPEISASNPSSDYVNYFIGNNPSAWASNVYHYNSLLFKNIYKDIDAT